MDVLTSLALDAGSGSSRAQEALVRATYGDVHRLCASLVDRQSADDLAQEVFVRALRGVRRFRGDASFRTWLLAITRHTCMDELRRRDRGRRRAPSGQLPDLELLRVSPDASHTSTVTDLLARLSPERRAAFVLTQHLGLSYDEAAAVCECPVGTVRSRVARAREDLIASMRALSEEVRPSGPSRKAPA